MNPPKPFCYDPEVILLAARSVADFYDKHPSFPGCEAFACHEAFACNEIKAAFRKKYETYQEVDTPNCVIRGSDTHKALFFNLFHPDAKRGYVPNAFWSTDMENAPSNRVTSLLFLYHILLSDPDFDFNP